MPCSTLGIAVSRLTYHSTFTHAFSAFHYMRKTGQQEQTRTLNSLVLQLRTLPFRPRDFQWLELLRDGLVILEQAVHPVKVFICSAPSIYFFCLILLLLLLRPPNAWMCVS